jgi:hypothetical protein
MPPIPILSNDRRHGEEMSRPNPLYCVRHRHAAAWTSPGRCCRTHYPTVYPTLIPTGLKMIRLGPIQANGYQPSGRPSPHVSSARGMGPIMGGAPAPWAPGWGPPGAVVSWGCPRGSVAGRRRGRDEGLPLFRVRGLPSIWRWTCVMDYFEM